MPGARSSEPDSAGFEARIPRRWLWAMSSHPMSDSTRRVYLVLLDDRFGNADEYRRRHALTYEAIAAATGLRRSLVVVAVGRLVAGGFVDRHSRGGRIPNRYELVDPAEWPCNRPGSANGSDSPDGLPTGTRRTVEGSNRPANLDSTPFKAKGLKRNKGEGASARRAAPRHLLDHEVLASLRQLEADQ